MTHQHFYNNRNAIDDFPDAGSPVNQTVAGVWWDIEYAIPSVRIGDVKSEPADWAMEMKFARTIACIMTAHYTL